MELKPIKEKQFNSLPIAEVFHSIQGEGQTMGIPAVFVRLGGCNILCQGEGWVCDTIEVWKKSKSTKFEDVLSPKMIMQLDMGAHLIFTGGEPLLHQTAIMHFIDWFRYKHGYLPVIEFETNGTIQFERDYLDALLYNMTESSIKIFFNVSPKLKSSGVKKDDRLKPEALLHFDKIDKRYSEVSVIYKFVVANLEDVEELQTDFMKYISRKKIMLMPAGSTQSELEQTRLFTVQMAIENSYRYCDRLHVVTWNKKTGV